MHTRTETILERSLSVVAVVILLASCQSVRMNDLPDPHIRGRAEFDRDQAARNVKILTDKNSSYCYPKEREYYPSCSSTTAQNFRPRTELALSGGGIQTVQSTPPQSSRPKIGLALSGGGMRSAAFSIGVMSGLANYPDRDRHKSINYMKSMDIISAVSGGSYALSWYYLQQYYMMQTWSELKDRETGKKCEKGYNDCEAGRKCENLKEVCGTDKKCDTLYSDCKAGKECQELKKDCGTDEKCDALGEDCKTYVNCEKKYNKCLEKVCERNSVECNPLLDKVRKDLLNPEGPFQVHLKNNGDLLGKTRAGIWTLFDIVAIPLHLISSS
jgi:hypothetical protein